MLLSSDQRPTLRADLPSSRDTHVHCPSIFTKNLPFKSLRLPYRTGWPWTSPDSFLLWRVQSIILCHLGIYIFKWKWEDIRMWPTMNRKEVSKGLLSKLFLTLSQNLGRWLSNRNKISFFVKDLHSGNKSHLTKRGWGCMTWFSCTQHLLAGDNIINGRIALFQFVAAKSINPIYTHAVNTNASIFSTHKEQKIWLSRHSLANQTYSVRPGIFLCQGYDKSKMSRP